MRRGVLFGLCLLGFGCDDGSPSADPRDQAVDAARAPDLGVDAALDASPADAAVDPDAMLGPPGPPIDEVIRLAGGSTSGFVDGIGAAARFNGVTCIALSPDGARLYASDTFNGLVRAIDLDSGAVSTLSGRPLELASFDGALDAARFSGPRGCVARADGLIVADGPTLRALDLAAGAVTTLAGQADARGLEDGVGGAARLGYLNHDITQSADGSTLYLADRSNDVIRVFELATGRMTTLASGGLNGPGGIAWVDDALFVADTFDGQLVRIDLGDFSAEVIADGLDAPQGLVLDGGTAWLGGFDGALHQIDRATGDVLQILGVPGDARALDGPRGTARLGGTFASPVLDPARRRLYYVDLTSGGVRQIDLDDLSVAPLAGPVAQTGHRDGPDPRFEALFDVVADGDGWLVSDPLNSAVRRIAADGSARTILGAPGEAETVDGPVADARARAPIGLAAVDGRIFVADYDADAIRLIADGQVTTFGRIGNTGVSGPWGLGAAPDGRVFLTEIDRGAIRVIRPDGTLGAVAPPGTFVAPSDVAVDPRDGAIYVADLDQAAIFRLDGSAAVRVAGQPGETGVRDGPLDAALLAGPTGLTFAPDGGLLVVDGANHLIRRIDLEAGIIERWLGHPTRHGGQPAGARMAWADATLEQPQAVAVGPDGALAVVSEAGLTIAVPGR